VGEVVDWCVVNESPDRHPMHLHANRFWVLGAGEGGLEECIKNGTKVGRNAD
jgi:FtsP/CotA-like multicopper oxidase with cupredoxin domain